MKMYNPYDMDYVLRHAAPGFSRLGSPVKLADRVTHDQLRKHNFEIAKTKAEIVQEYYGVMGHTYRHLTKSLAAGAIAVYCIFQLAASGGTMFLAGSMLSTAMAMYWWWRSGAAYSNWQEFEMRPLLMPIEDIGQEQAGITAPPKSGD
ncbi:MAG: hypothetical protein NTY90_00040 [Candidatus Micrarchaeota archaeon]|nr:hypothetical protein [Candidatus Micrarchaeota archaeon]